jgi:hypothetical protein
MVSSFQQQKTTHETDFQKRWLAVCRRPVNGPSLAEPGHDEKRVLLEARRCDAGGSWSGRRGLRPLDRRFSISHRGGPFQKALLIVSATRCVSALQAELPTNVPTLVELKSMNGLAKVAVWPDVAV